jgi:hypothetical protein
VTPPDEGVSAEPASPEPEPEPVLEPVLAPVAAPEPETVESPAHEESVPEPALPVGVVVAGLVVVVVAGSELGETVVVAVVVAAVPGSELLSGMVVVEELVEAAGVRLLVSVAGQPVVPVAPVVSVAPVVGVAAGLVDPGSTVESVCVWVRPGGGAGVVPAFVFAFVPALTASSAGCLGVSLAGGLCATVAVTLAGAGGWCRCTTALAAG